MSGLSQPSIIVATTYKVDVTQEDIDKGVSSLCRECPIARAVNRAIPGSMAEVYGYSVLMRLPSGKLAWAAMPTKAANFITRFDCKLPVDPFTFTLTLDEPFTA